MPCQFRRPPAVLALVDGLAEVLDQGVDGRGLTQVDHLHVVGPAGGQDEGEVMRWLPAVFAAGRYGGEVEDVETDELDAGRRELNTALSIGGKDYALAHYYLAQAHLKSGERDEAISELKTFLER